MEIKDYTLTGLFLGLEPGPLRTGPFEAMYNEAPSLFNRLGPIGARLVLAKVNKRKDKEGRSILEKGPELLVWRYVDDGTVALLCPAE